MAARREGAVRHGRAVTTAASCREDTGETRRCARRDGPAPTLDDPDARHAIFAAGGDEFAGLLVEDSHTIDARITILEIGDVVLGHDDDA